MHGKAIIYWNLQWGMPLEWVSYLTPVGRGELLNLHWDLVSLLPELLKLTILMQTEEGILVWHISLPVHLLLSDNAASPSQHVWYTQPSQVLKTPNLPLLKVRSPPSFFY